MEIDGIKFTLIPSNRKTIGVIVESDGEPVLRVPKDASKELIEEIVRPRLSWVRNKIRETYSLSSEMWVPEYTTGSRLPYLGRFHEISEEAAPRFGLYNGRFRVPVGSESEIESLAHDWFLRRALHYLPLRLEQIGQMYVEKSASSRISDLKGRWASCSNDGTLNLNWKLMLLPPKLIDYVLHHELAHLRIHNHSPRYWKHLAQHCPEWESLNEELDSVGARFFIPTAGSNTIIHGPRID